MANIVITSVTDSVKVEFNDYFPNAYPIEKAYYNMNDLEKVECYATMVVVHLISSDDDWELSHDGSAGFQVDTIDGATPSDLGDLCDKIGALIKA